MVSVLAPLVLRALALVWLPPPQPRVHDEFSHLLAADTFAHGRLANPQHPFWVHFESMHILVRPVYASAFPIGQGAVLAAGQILLGHPWAGVWLSVGLMCGAICWMLQGWLPPRWALLGAALAIMRLGVSGYWMNSYWGGAVAAAGGALVAGALPRIMRQPHWRHAVVMGLGLAILANSRTFEGAVFGLAIGVALLVWMRRHRVAPRQIVLPLAALLALTVAGMGYCFGRITGRPWLAPYTLYRNSMTMAPHFVWQNPRPRPLYNSSELRHFYAGLEMNQYLEARTSFLAGLGDKFLDYWRFYLGPLLSIPLLALPWLWKDRKARLPLWLGAAFSLSLVGQVWHNPHYAAPATGLIFLIVAMGLRRLGRLAGPWLVPCFLVACAALLVFHLATDGRSLPGLQRAGVLRQLEALPGNHLVFMRYGVWHDRGDEWVYNGADIDQSRVVWARELDRASNEKLMRYFAGRHVWLMEPDRPPARPIPYETAPYRPMPFVQLGAPGIEVLRSPDQVRRAVLAKAQSTLYGCDGWSYYFTEATGVESPDVSHGCYTGNDRSQKVTFDQWFAWLRRQP